MKSVTESYFTDLSKLVDATNEIKGASFASLEYTNQEGEEQKTLINIGVSYESAKAKDVEMLKALTNEDLAKKFPTHDLATLVVAKEELINSLVNPSENRSNGQKNAYTWINNGLKFHNETGDLYIFGFVVSKTVTKSGVYKEVKSSAKTLAKNVLRKEMKSAQYRQYNVDMTGTAKLKGETLEFTTK